MSRNQLPPSGPRLGLPPTTGRGIRPKAPTYGWFAEDSTGAVVLVDRWGHSWSLSRVSILTGSFGFDEEGFEKLPRVARFDSAGNETVAGDRVVIDFLDQNPKLPLVRGGVRSMGADAFLHYNHESEGADENRLAVRLRQLDSAGEEVGLIELEAGHDLGGNIGLTLDGDLVITVKRDDGDHTITITDDGIKIDAGGSTDVTVNGGTAKVARVGDKTTNHTHPAGTLVAGYFTVTGATGATQPQIVEGADRFKG